MEFIFSVENTNKSLGRHSNHIYGVVEELLNITIPIAQILLLFLEECPPYLSECVEVFVDFFHNMCAV